MFFSVCRNICRDAIYCVSTCFHKCLFLLIISVLFIPISSSAQTQESPFFPFCSDAPTVTDHEGNKYRTVQIGSQCWMAENLRCKTSSTDKTWLFNPNFSASQPQYAAYYATSTINRYGMLYNWAAALDLSSHHSNARPAGKKVRGICPEGWHLPDNEDWSLLFNTLGGHQVSGEVMKAPTQQWQPHLIIQKGNNMGFDAEPAGSYTENGSQNAGFQATFWSSDNFNRDQAWCCIVYDYKNEGYNYLDYKCYGHSVRCVRDEEIRR